MPRLQPITVRFPPYQLDAITAEAERLGISASRFIADAAWLAVLEAQRKDSAQER